MLLLLKHVLSLMLYNKIICRMTNYELLCWLVETLSHDIHHYRMLNVSAVKSIERRDDVTSGDCGVVCIESRWDNGRRPRCAARDATVHLHRQSSQSGQDGRRPPCCRWQSTHTTPHTDTLSKVKYMDIAVCSITCHTPHMPYRTIQCYLPLGRGDIHAFTPAEAGARLSDPRGMQGWVELVPS